MNSFELNKILGAVLATCLLVLALSIGAGAIFAPETPAKPGYAIAVKEAGSGEKAAAPEASKPIEVLLADASVEKGQAIAKQCQACHTFEKGGPNRVGPNLWNVVGDERGKGRGGYDFSDSMKKKGGEWTFEELNKFLKDPRGYIPGTKMSFAGISRDQQRADVIDFLRTQADKPLPLPKVAEAAPAAKAPEAKAPEAKAPEAKAPAATPAAPAAAPPAAKPAEAPKTETTPPAAK